MHPTLRRVVKRLLGPSLVEKLRPKPTVVLSNDDYDSLGYQIMQRCLKPDSVAIDVGCHEGIFLTRMLELAPGGRLYAFEPLPHMFEALQVKFTSPQITILNLALSDETSVASFNHVITNPGYSGLRKRSYDRPDEQDQTIVVHTDRLDNVIPSSDRVAFIKVDVEGAELQVFRGAVETIKRSKPVILFEHGLGAADSYGTRPGQVYDLLCGECGLQISLLQSWLNRDKALSRKAFEEAFDKGKTFMFVAHPAFA